MRRCTAISTVSGAGGVTGAGGVGASSTLKPPHCLHACSKAGHLLLEQRPVGGVDRRLQLLGCSLILARQQVILLYSFAAAEFGRGGLAATGWSRIGRRWLGGDSDGHAKTPRPPSRSAGLASLWRYAPSINSRVRPVDSAQVMRLKTVAQRLAADTGDGVRVLVQLFEHHLAQRSVGGIGVLKGIAKLGDLLSGERGASCTECYSGFVETTELAPRDDGRARSATG